MPLPEWQEGIKSVLLMSICACIHQSDHQLCQAITFNVTEFIHEGLYMGLSYLDTVS